ncbi:MAG: hypothetical protein R3E01_20010 [Pirellulaceae bacterium]|nr:hypothetical protein [Planctomycetales bacterium]
MKQKGEGAAVGTNQVRITCFPSQKPDATNDGGGELALGRSLIPTHYNSFGSSGLTVDVQPGENEPFNIELTD